MPAPKGNQYWKMATNPGRKRTFEKAADLRTEAGKYFDLTSKRTWFKTEQIKKPVTTTHITPTGKKKQKVQYTVQIPMSVPFTYEGLALFLGTHKKFFNWFTSDMESKSDSEDPKVAAMAEEFLDVLAWIDDVITCQKKEGAMVGVFHAGIVASELRLAKFHDNTDRVIIVEVDE